MSTFKTWQHPASGEMRVYIAGLAGQRSAKVFIVAKSQDEFGYAYDIKTQIPEGVYADRNQLINSAEAAINEAAKSRVKTFDEVMLLAN